MNPEELQNLAREAQSRLESLQTPAQLEEFRIAYLGRKGKVTCLFEALKTAPSEERRTLGQKLNELKNSLEEKLKGRQSGLSASGGREKEFLDPTLPGIRPASGRIHPLTQTIRRITGIFERLGFEVAEGPEIETEFYNFTALNIPLDHPSRDAFATFYTQVDSPRESPFLLRSQTSTVQIRVMQKRKPPLRIIAPGRVYRPDRVDASHAFMFHQIEGLMVDERTTFSELKGVLHLFLRQLLGPETKIRFRPHFFPFTEPSAEVDVNCFLCDGRGCSVCGGKGWLELLGAGSVDPAVFEQVGYDPKRVQGFAFGLGVERIAMLMHGISDIRMFLENDLRFLRQF
ncbi:MAG: phenylalanine--tRNA ligase subunit alpha [Candidatus Omnitrophica bacterium]|nr:phenylalanine--tRNA ligase subunit alpha [Candidatus Omnitrophota bacterium]